MVGNLLQSRWQAAQPKALAGTLLDTGLVAVCRHYHAVMSVHNVKLMIAFAWFYSLVFSAVPFFVNNWDTVQR